MDAPHSAAPFSLWLLCLAVSPAGGFFVDTDQPIVFQDGDQSFGYQVVQMRNRVIVSAPLQQTDTNRTGQLYQCDPGSRACQPITMTGNAADVNISLGLVLAAQQDPPELLACGPTLKRTCGKNIYVNGQCYQLDQRLQLVGSLPLSLPECSIVHLDIAFLIDGSGSIAPSDFTLMLNFVSTVMEAFRGKHAQFALMQYSSRFETHFDFNQYAATRDPRALTRNINQLGGQTWTPTAIYKVLTELFIPESGSRTEAQKVLIVITDGETTGDRRPYSDSIGRAERMGVLRFVIGVGNAFDNRRAQNELKTIASQPSEDHVLRVDNFSALSRFQEALQEKIFAIEGTESQTGSSFEMEMSQDGFSAILTPEGPVLGAVGAYDWSGGASFFRGQAESVIWINVTEDQKDLKGSYMGYSLQLLERDLLALGAPRHEHKGSVMIFKRDPATSSWRLRAMAKGDKIGSYFGSTLSVVEVDANFPRTLLVVGAPTYYSPDVPGGRVYLCPIPDMDSTGPVVTVSCPDTLSGDTSRVLGHFGSAMAVLMDLTGDKVTDMAIGAPCEDNNRGAVYIFGGQPGGFRASYIQRIAGSLLGAGFMFFGRSVSGNLDMTNDGLPDLTIGTEGKVFLLKSRPVLGVSISFTFEPKEIPLSVFECPDPTEQGKELMVNVCVFTSMRSDRHIGSFSTDLQYTLLLDHGRTQTRALFPDKQRSLDTNVNLNVGTACRAHAFQLPECVEDSLSPLRVALNFSLSGLSVLSEDSFVKHFGQVPFEKNCGSDGLCEDDLRVNATFSGLVNLVVAVSLDVNLTISVQNLGDDSYDTRVLISLPPDLSYRRVSLVQSNRRIAVTCAPLLAQQVVRCGINNPLLRPNTTAIFLVGFHVSTNATLGDTLTLTANVTSDNGGPVQDAMKSTASVKVLYGIYITVTSLEESTKYTNFSSSEGRGTSTPRRVQHVYRVINLGQHALPLSVVFMIPVKLGDSPLWEQAMVSSSEPGPTNCITTGEKTAAQDSRELQKTLTVLNCSVATCLQVECHVENMEIRKSINFTISGNVTREWGKQTEQQKVFLQTSAEISYDFGKYQHPTEQDERFIRAQAQTVLEVITEYDYRPVIVGSSVGGLAVVALIAAGLYKLGFFKRQYKQMMSEPEGQSSPSQDPDGSAPHEPQENAAHE
ncbi:integrin alpha-M-like [Spea bombifrons]|uniref:integrin alpha-M-like n=1 Tax=Spea bombifrons TaxID=233779 RepID=UPI00234B26C0|nr:integrin alpha-M-like [Spea bombifrons]